MAESRSDLFPRLLVGTGAMFAGFAIMQRSRAGAVVNGGGGRLEASLPTRSGATIRYREVHPEFATRRDGRVFVLACGAISSPSMFAWLEDQLVQAGYSVVTYHRGGYGASRLGVEPHRGDTETDTEDLRDLVRPVGRGRRVTIVGHSLGGYLAQRACCGESRPGDDGELPVDSLILLEPTDPGEYRRPEQLAGAIAMRRSLSESLWITRVGLGLLLPVPSYYNQLPPARARSAIAEFRLPKTWLTGLTEWDEMYRKFSHDDRHHPLIESPRLSTMIVATRSTIDSYPGQYEAYERLLGDSPADCRLETVEVGNHFTLLSDRLACAELFTLVEKFMTTVDAEIGEAG